MTKQLNKREGCNWIIKAKHYLGIKSGNKIFVYESREEGNEQFDAQHTILFKSVWRGWVRKDTEISLDF